MAFSLRYLNRIIGLACLHACAAYALHAQPHAGPREAVSVAFTVFAPRAVAGLAYLPKANAAATPTRLKFYHSYRSPVYRYEGPAELCFYDEAELTQALRAASEKGAFGDMRLPEPVACCVIPEGAREVFLLFMPSGTGRRHDIVVVEENETRLPPGHAVLINVSGLDLVGRINGKTTPIPVGAGDPVPAKNGVVSLAVARTEPKYRRLVVADRWDLGSRQRDRVIIFPPSRPTALLPEIVRVSDLLPERSEPRAPGSR